MSLSQRLKADFSTLTLALIAVAIVLNIVRADRLPAQAADLSGLHRSARDGALLAGPWAGGLTGLLTDLIWGLISDPVAAAFAPVAMVIGIMAGLLAKVGLFKKWWQAIISGVIIAVALSIIAIPIRVFMFGGVTGSGADFITAYLLATGRDLLSAVLITVIGDNIIDKVVTALLAWAIVKGLPRLFTGRFPPASTVID